MIIHCSGCESEDIYEAHCEQCAESMDKEHDDLIAKANKLAEALEKCKGAMKYAYEDHVDEFYMNHLRDIEQALKEYRGEK